MSIGQYCHHQRLRSAATDIHICYTVDAIRRDQPPESPPKPGRSKQSLQHDRLERVQLRGGQLGQPTDPNGICSWSWTDWTGCVADGAGSAWYGLGAATHYTWDHFKNEIVGCAAGGATGAVIGSIVPGIGNASGAIGGCLGGAATQAVGDLWGQPYKSEFSIINLVRRLSGLL